MRTIVVLTVMCLALVACQAGSANQPASSNVGDSGITSSNGGGQRALGNTPNVSVGTGGTTLQPAPSSRGNAY